MKRKGKDGEMKEGKRERKRKGMERKGKGENRKRGKEKEGARSVCVLGGCLSDVVWEELSERKDDYISV